MPEPQLLETEPSSGSTSLADLESYFVSTYEIDQVPSLVTTVASHTTSIATNSSNYTLHAADNTIHFADAPADGTYYTRLNNAWAASPAGVTDAPSDGNYYVRQDAAWVDVDTELGISSHTSNTSVHFADATSDGNLYARQDGGWVQISNPPGGVTEAPVDGNSYVRKNGGWTDGYVEFGIASILADIVALETHEADTDIHWSDAPADSTTYGRKNNAWVSVSTSSVLGSVLVASDGNTAPNCSAVGTLVLNNTAPTTVVNFQNGTNGQRMAVVILDAGNTTIQDNTVIFLEGVDYSPGGPATMEFIYYGSKWKLVSNPIVH